MGSTYTRQSSAGIVDGGVIEASDLNNEFDQLLAAFAVSTGHTHDGTAAEGGPVTKLLGNTLTFGAGTAGTDITITFDGETSDGVMYWMEDEDHFKFADDVVIDSSKRLYLYDEGGEYIYGDGTDLYLTSGADINIPADIGLTFGNDGEKIEGNGTNLTIAGGDINLTAEADVNIPSDIGITFGDDGEKIEGDGTNLTISTSNNVTVDAAADIILDAGGADVTLKDDGTTFGSLTQSGGELLIKSGSTPTTAMTFSGANVTFAGTVTIGSAGINEAELEILDGATVTTTELNIMDGDTSASSTTLAAADRVVVNDNGTMKQVALSDFETFFESDLDTFSTITISTALLPDASGGADLGSTTYEWGDVYIGDDKAIKFGADQDVTIEYDEDGTDTLLISGHATFADDKKLYFGTGKDISLEYDEDGTDKFIITGNTTFADGSYNFDIASHDGTNGLALGGTVVTTSAAELNLIDGGTSRGTTAVADGDGILHNDAGTMRMTSVETFATYFASEITGSSSIVTVGALDSGSITSGFGAIDNGTSGIRTNTFTAETSIVPDASGGADIGSTSAEWGDIFIADDKAIKFGSDQDVTIEYDEDGTDSLLISGGDVTIVDDKKLYFGTGQDVYLEYDEDGTDKLIIKGNTTFLDGSYNFDIASHDGTNGLALGGTVVTTSAAELNLIDGGTSRGTTSVASGDGILINDGGTMRMTNVDTVSTYFSSHNVGGGNIVTTGALDSGSITSGFGAIDNGTSGIRTNTFTAETSIIPDASGGADLGSTSAEWGDFFIADDKYIQFGSDQNVVIGYDEDGNDSLEFKANIEGAALAFTFSADQADDNADTWKLNLADGGTWTWQSYTSGSFATKLTLDTSGDLTVAGDLTVSGDDITLGTNTNTAIMVADGTNYNPVVPSGDVGLTNAGVFSIASGVIVNADVNASAAIADSKLATISTSNKVGLAALDIDGGTDIGAAIVDADLFIIDDGAGGTNRKVTASRIKTYAAGGAATMGKAIAMALVFG